MSDRWIFWNGFRLLYLINEIYKCFLFWLSKKDDRCNRFLHNITEKGIVHCYSNTYNKTINKTMQRNGIYNPHLSKGGKTKCVNTIVGSTWLYYLYIRELPNIRGWTERKTKCYKRVTFALHSMSVWTVFESIMLHRRLNGAIWDILSLSVGT